MNEWITTTEVSLTEPTNKEAEENDIMICARWTSACSGQLWICSLTSYMCRSQPGRLQDQIPIDWEPGPRCFP